MAESKTVVECEDGHNYTSRVVTDDDEDEREDVASVWSSFYFYLQLKYVTSTISLQMNLKWWLFICILFNKKSKYNILFHERRIKVEIVNKRICKTVKCFQFKIPTWVTPWSN